MVSAQVLSAAGAAAAGLSTALPQTVRILRLKDASGVSVAGLAGALVGYSGWAAYAVLSDDLLYAAVNGVTALVILPAFLASFVYGASLEGLRQYLLLVPVGLLALQLAGPTLLALLLVGNALVAFFRSGMSAWGADGVRGLSPVGWSAGAIAAACYLVYGAVTDQMPVAVSGAVNLVGCLVVLSAVFFRRERRHPAPLASL